MDQDQMTDHSDDESPNSIAYTFAAAFIGIDRILGAMVRRGSLDALGATRVLRAVSVTMENPGMDDQFRRTLARMRSMHKPKRKKHSR
jgi:hypothetical protein